ncbi:MAG TPA: hypothetical protein VMM78_11995 [Thermomicrobiales bacterium]|nr:hypothetical protein [Thermomicrobiales bacterium]
MADNMERMRDQVQGDPNAGKKTAFGVTAMIAITALAIFIGAFIVIAVM